jgi:hypothetical protein
MARPENRSEGRSISISLPQETFDYLAWLASLGKLGKTENEVAYYILVKEVEDMYANKLHDRKIPAADPSRGGPS